jgi:hypothetical protein
MWHSWSSSPKPARRQRDRTNLKDTHWHVRFPLDPDFACPGIPAAQYDVLELLREVVKQAPYWVRFQGNREPGGGRERLLYEAAVADFAAAKIVSVTADDMSVREPLLLATRALPNPGEWQLTQLPSHLLLYREKNADYPRMTRLWPTAE